MRRAGRGATSLQIPAEHGCTGTAGVPDRVPCGRHRGEGPGQTRPICTAAWVALGATRGDDPGIGSSWRPHAAAAGRGLPVLAVPALRKQLLGPPGRAGQRRRRRDRQPPPGPGGRRGWPRTGSGTMCQSRDAMRAMGVDTARDGTRTWHSPCRPRRNGISPAPDLVGELGEVPSGPAHPGLVGVMDFHGGNNCSCRADEIYRRYLDGTIRLIPCAGRGGQAGPAARRRRVRCVGGRRDPRRG
ncbi:hypothetical protein SANTM175S_04100 [Streptomyces antimycoticus]